jgi:four helix bundle protein
MSNLIEDLEVFKLAEIFADEVWFIVLEWDYFSKDTVGKQLVRSADSIGANIAEGFGRFHFKENKNFCYFSRGSLVETKGWLRKAKSRNLITDEKFNDLLGKINLIHLKLNTYIKYIGNKIEKNTD